MDNRMIKIVSLLQQTLIGIYTTSCQNLYKHISEFSNDFNVNILNEHSDIIQCLSNLHNTINTKLLFNYIHDIIKTTDKTPPNVKLNIKSDDVISQQEYNDIVNEPNNINIYGMIFNNFSEHKDDIIRFIENI